MARAEKSKIILVNEQDEVIGHKERGTLEKGDIYQVSALWLVNDKGENLLARRAYTKSHHPGKWGPAVAGTVDEGETYLENIVKETEEEIGLPDLKFEELIKTRSTGDYDHFTKWYLTRINKKIDEFSIQKEEVAEIKWFSKEELLNKIKTNPDDFIPTLIEKIPKLLSLIE